MTLLSVSDLDAAIGGVRVIRGIDIEVGEGEIVAIVGANGAGKTTTMRAIMGVIEETTGSIQYRREEISGLAPYERKRRGIGFAPQERRLFTRLTARENILMTIWGSDDPTTYDVDDRLAVILETFPKVEEFLDRSAGNLSGGEQQMTAIARALASDPELLLLDEPFEGLAPSIRQDLREGIGRIRELGVSVFMAESEINHILDTADRAYALERGEIVTENDPDALLENDEVMRIIGG